VNQNDAKSVSHDIFNYCDLLFSKNCIAKIGSIWDRCHDFKNIFSKKLAFLLKLLLVFAKNLIITLAFEKNAVFKPKIG
jgi:hypothetical protein